MAFFPDIETLREWRENTGLRGDFTKNMRLLKDDVVVLIDQEDNTSISLEWRKVNKNGGFDPPFFKYYVPSEQHAEQVLGIPPHLISITLAG